MRAACAKALPVVNVFEEAAYWTAAADGSGRTLSGGHDYVLHFPPGQLPPNDAFWSLTVTDIVGYMVSNPTGRSSVDDRSDLAKNADGSIDIYLQHERSNGAGAELAADAGRQIQADAPRLSARRGDPGRQLPRAAGREGT